MCHKVCHIQYILGWKCGAVKQAMATVVQRVSRRLTPLGYDGKDDQPSKRSFRRMVIMRQVTVSPMTLRSSNLQHEQNRACMAMKL